MIKIHRKKSCFKKIVLEIDLLLQQAYWVMTKKLRPRSSTIELSHRRTLKVHTNKTFCLVKSQQPRGKMVSTNSQQK